MTAPDSDYRETLWVPLTWWLLGAGFVIAVWWAFYVSTPVPVIWIATVVAAAIVGGGLTKYGSARVVVDGETLRAGLATLPRRYVGDVQPVEGEAVRRLLGVEADARAYVVYRAYVKGAVKVDVADERDRTPYWVISTRHPTALAERLRATHMQD
jgi:hypothetical protein